MTKTLTSETSPQLSLLWMIMHNLVRYMTKTTNGCCCISILGISPEAVLGKHVRFGMRMMN